MTETLVFGKPQGTNATRVYERSGTATISEPRIGTSLFVMNAKRGPEGVPVPLNSKNHYNSIFGDKGNDRWHLFQNSAHTGPDAVDGYYKMAGAQGNLIVIRVDQEGGSKSELILKSPSGAEVLKFTAANKGRWGGYTKHLSQKPLIIATARTFSIYAPEIQSNELAGAEAVFNDGSGHVYEIVSNSSPDDDGIVICTVSSQYDLTADGVYGIGLLSGLASYTTRKDLTGTIAFPDKRNLTGTWDTSERIITGTGGAATTELTVGSNLYSAIGEVRTIVGITENNIVTLDRAFTQGGAGQTLQINNFEVTGTGTDFTQIKVGSNIYFSVLVDNEMTEYTRRVLKVNSATSMVMTSGVPISIPGGSIAEMDNLVVKGDALTDFNNEVFAGNYIIDPSKPGTSALVTEVSSTTNEFTIKEPFSADFTNVRLSKQSQFVNIGLEAGSNEGLSVRVGPGSRYPETHFSLEIFFNGTSVMNFADASIDPNSTDFVETLVHDNNIAHSVGSKTYYKYITCETLWTSAYTTAETNDVRPCNGSGKVLGIQGQRIYSVGEFNHEDAIGSRIYPNFYEKPRSFVRVKSAVNPMDVEGSISTIGATVYGEDTNFTALFSSGDYIYDTESKTARQIAFVLSDTQLTLVDAFAEDVAPLTPAKRAGYLQVDRGIDLGMFASIGRTYLVSFTETLKGGSDPDSSKLIPYDFYRYFNKDNDVIERALDGKNLGLVRIATPGIDFISVLKEGALYAKLSGLEFRYEVPSHYDPAGAEIFVNETVGRNSFTTVCYPSYGHISDPLGAGTRMVPLTGDLMGLETYVATSAKGWHVPAAGVDAVLSRVLSLPYEIDPGEEATLNRTGIQPIKEVFGNYVPWGVDSPATDAIYQSTHIRRIQSHMIRTLLEALSIMRMLFRPNQPDMAGQLQMILESYLRENYRRGTFNQFLAPDEAFSVQIMAPGQLQENFSNMDDSDVIASISQGDLTVEISYVPAGVLKNLNIYLGPSLIAAKFAS